jgi:hypothetical protein
VPRKAAFLRFEEDESAEFAFYLAEKLGRTVAELEAEMSNQEFIEWGVYYGRKAQRQELASKQGR